MRPTWRSSWGLGLLVVPISLVTLLAQTQPAPAPPLIASTSAKECVPGLKTEYQREANGVTIEGEKVFFRGFSLISMNVCEAGELLIDAEPQLAGTEAPRLVIGLNDESLGRRTIRQREIFRIPLKSGGKVTLGYFNDYYQSEARVVSYEKFKLSDSTCGRLKVLAPPETGGVYNPVSNSVSTTSTVPITIQPCGPGLLSFRILGRAALGEYPIVKLSQPGQADRLIRTSALRQAVQVRVSDAPLTLTLTNRYFKELADRNLILHSVQFVPRP